MWNEVVNAKFIKKYNMYDLIRKSNKLTQGVSNIRFSFMHSFNVMGDWLAWRPSDGNLIKVGEDPIVGFTNYYELSNLLVNLLHEKCIYSLSHVSKDQVSNDVTHN